MNYVSCSNIAQYKKNSTVLNNMVVALPELAKEDTIHTLCMA